MGHELGNRTTSEPTAVSSAPATLAVVHQPCGGPLAPLALVALMVTLARADAEGPRCLAGRVFASDDGPPGLPPCWPARWPSHSVNTTVSPTGGLPHIT
jgi:hypothetical protein